MFFVLIVSTLWIVTISILPSLNCTSRERRRPTLFERPGSNGAPSSMPWSDTRRLAGLRTALRAGVKPLRPLRTWTRFSVEFGETDEKECPWHLQEEVGVAQLKNHLRSLTQRADKGEASTEMPLIAEKVFTFETLHNCQNHRQLLKKGQQKNAGAKTVNCSLPNGLGWDQCHWEDFTDFHRAERQNQRRQLPIASSVWRTGAMGDSGPEGFVP